MDSANLTKNNPLNENYGPLLTGYARTILETGLLLDEDYEVLLKTSNFKMYPNKSLKPPLGLIASSLTTLSSVFIAKKCNLSIIVFPPLAVTLALVCLEIRSKLKMRRFKEVVKYVVQNLIRIRKLNTEIIRYVKMRLGLSSSGENESSLLYNKNIEEFIKLFLKHYQELFKTMLNELDFLTTSTNELANDFEGLKEINIDVILNEDNFSVNDHVVLTSKVHDIYTLLSSKFLNYLGITFCRNLRNINASELEFLLDKKLPGINATLNKLREAMQKEFNNLRYCASKKVEIGTKYKISLRRHVSGKLEQTLIGAINNLSIIMEKSQAVLLKVESAENGNDVKILERVLGDLRDHAFATYESLDVLCKLYGILYKENTAQSNVQKHVNTQINIDTSNVATVSFDDTTEPLEENYEIFIPENKDCDFQPGPAYEDQSGMYLSLMLKELRQSLKQHERFVAARSKREINDEDDDKSDDEIRTTTVRKKTPPKFNLSVFNAVKECNPEKEVSEDTLSQVDLLPPPIPPPPPTFKLDDLHIDNPDTGNNKMSFSDSIKALSSQVQGEEDIFGDKDYSSSSDSE